MQALLFDKGKIKRSFSAAAADYDRFAHLQRQVGNVLLARFPPRGQPERVLDLGSGTGFLARRLMAMPGVADVVALDIALAMLQANRRLNADTVAYVCADAESLPLAADVVSHVYSNLAMQWVERFDLALAECRRVLRPGGRLVFSTFGSHTLCELKAAWAAVDGHTHVNRFLSADEISAALQTAGFHSHRLQQQSYCCSYPSVLALMRELKAIGAHNVNQARKRSTTTPSQLQRMIQHYPANADGSIIATYDVLLIEATT